MLEPSALGHAAPTHVNLDSDAEMLGLLESQLSAPTLAFKFIVLLSFFYITVLCRYRVVYRLVNTVYVMAVASAAANVFSLMKLVDAITRVATLASRGVEVTPEKLSRRYPEVYIQPF